jgi:hypothetical protein
MILNSYKAWLLILALLSGLANDVRGEAESSVLPPWLQLWPRYQPDLKPKVPQEDSPSLKLPPPPLSSSLPPWLGQVQPSSATSPKDKSATTVNPVVPATALQSDPIILEEPLQVVPSPPVLSETEITTGNALPEIEQQPLMQRSYWHYPSEFFTTGDWSKSAELGINGTDGNSQTMSMVAGLKLKRKTDREINDLRLTSQKTNTNGEETQNNTLLYYDYELFLGASPWSLFVKSGLEYDEFKAFDLRLFVNSGLAYKFIRTKELTTGVRFGVGTSREFGGPDDRWVPELLFGFDHEHQVNKRNKVSFKADYYPEWSDFENYRVVLDASWEYLFDEAGNLSVKLSAIDRYDSTPNGAKPNDLNYALLLMYKF